MPRTVENADGMFPVEKNPLDEMTEEDWARAGRDLDEAFGLTACLAGIGRRIESLVGDPREISTGREQSWARQLALAIDAAPAYLNTGNPVDAMMHGVRIGMLAQRLDVLRFERKVVQVARTTRKLRDAAKKRGHSPEKVTEALVRYDQLRAADPTRKKGAVEKQVEAETGFPARTLRYYRGKRRKG